MKQQFDVFHKLASSFMDNTDAELAAFPTNFRHVATVEVEDVGQVFQVTNHIDSNWTENPEVLWSASKQIRSTSVGDVYRSIDGTKRYAVQSIGLREF